MIDTYQSYDVAIEQLHTALELYFEGKYYFSVITLAGAAEEILGKAAKAQKGYNSLEMYAKAQMGMHKKIKNEDLPLKDFIDYQNHYKNKTKHVNPSKEPKLTLDKREEAIDMLNRAIDNYLIVFDGFTPPMKQFQDERRKEFEPIV